MEQVDVALARWATGSGAAVVDDATAALDRGEEELTVASRLRRSVEPDRAAFALTAAVARRRARLAGVDGAERLVLTREALEQASAPAVASWRAAHVVARRDALGGGGPLVDLCGGTGADAVALAALGGTVVAVERDPGRAVLLEHRAAVLGLPVEVVVGDALDPPIPLRGRVVHADPDRRDARGRRARSLGQHVPPVGDLLAATEDRGAAWSFVTVAPGVAWDDPALPVDACVSFVELDGRLVEAVVERGGPTPRARAVRLPEGAVAIRADDRTRLPVGEVGTHLLLPGPALVRARLHDELGARHGARRLAARRALLTVDDPVDDPWFACEQVLATLAPRPQALRAWLRSPNGADAAAGGVEVLTHGVDEDPVRFLRAAGAPTGPHGVRVHLVRLDSGATAVVTAAPGR